MNEILMLRRVRRLFINGTKQVESEMRRNGKNENGFWHGK